MSIKTKVLAGALAVTALGATTAVAADRHDSIEVPGKAGVRVINPANHVEAGKGRNIGVGVRFTEASRRAGVRAVVVKLIALDDRGTRDHAGKAVFRPGGGKRQTGALTATSAGLYYVQYDILTGPDTRNGERRRVEYRVQVASS
jgi:hypothetical protein